MQEVVENCQGRELLRLPGQLSVETGKVMGIHHFQGNGWVGCLRVKMVRNAKAMCC